MSRATAGQLSTVGFGHSHCLRIGSDAVPEIFDQFDPLDQGEP